jgi:hypothetical protein
MPSLPDIPGKNLITGMTKRTRVVAAAAGAGALAIGGFVVKRVLGHVGDDRGEGGTSADPIAETPTAPPGAEAKPVPKPKAAKAKPQRGNAEKPDAGSKPKPAKPKPGPKGKAPKAGKAKPVRPKAPKPKPGAKPPKTTGTDAPPEPDSEPGNQTGGKDPHHALNNPVVDDPDMTEYPDPYDNREDPRDPDDAPFGEASHPQTGAESTSEPPPAQDPEVENGGRPPRRDKLDS